MSDEQVNAAVGDESKKYSETEAKLLEFIAECLDEGWCPTKCGQSCVARTRRRLSARIHKRCNRVRACLKLFRRV